MDTALVSAARPPQDRIRFSRPVPTFDVRDHLLDDSCGVRSLQQCLRTHADTVHKCERCAVRAREGLLRDDDGSEDTWRPGNCWSRRL